MARVLQDQLNRQGFQSELLSYFNHDIDLTQTLVFTNDLNLNRVFNIVMHFVLKREIIVNDLSQILNMMIRLVITISRLSINHLMNSPQEILISELDKDSVALIIRDSLQYYDLTLSKDDYHYIRVDQGGTLSQHTQNLVEVTNALITGVSQVTGHDYTSDGQLQENLYTHLAQSLNNNPATSAYSPFVKDIKANYPDLFTSLSQICQQQFQAQNDLVTDGFVSYIALHFLVSLQRDLKAQRKVRIVYVCATGLGVTTLIQSRIKATIANVEIAGFASINNAKLVTQQLHPDLVISIFPLPNFETPVIEVQPLPTQEDLTRIKAAVAKQLKTPEEALMLTNNTAESDLDDNALESDTKAIILMMFEITGDLITRLPPIKRQYQDAFRMHVFLAVHRIMFDQQFDANQYHVDTELGHIVQKIFDQHNLKINNSEINALLEYVQLSEK
ncbi:BglG family transcription antiterminator [Lacticaseibacillus saniviri]|nr:PRD domain-containing protein [Lacticaseibacillus saniviri]